MSDGDFDRLPLSNSSGADQATSLPRDYLYLVGFLLGIANVGFQAALADTQTNGLLFSLLSLFGFSALVWATLPAIISVLVGEGTHLRPASRMDMVLVLVMILACLAPMRAAAASAASLLALHALATNSWRSPLSRAALITLSSIAALYWGRVLLAMSGTVLLDIDVWLAGTFSGLETQGNMLLFASLNPEFFGEGFMVAAGCSSLHGVSLALLAFVLITQFYDLPISCRTAFWGFIGVLATIAVNISRLSAMGHYPELFEWIHVGAGATIAGYASLVLVLAANLGGNWRAITSIE